MLLEFSSASDLRDHYDRIRSKFFPPPPKTMRPPPVIVIEPPPPPPPVDPAEIILHELPQQHFERVHTMLERFRALAKRPSIKFVQAVCSKAFHCHLDDMLSHCRRPEIVQPRHASIFLARTVTKQSLPVIGRAFGNRDHTTVLHACRKYDHLLRPRPVMVEVVPIPVRVVDGQALQLSA